MTPIDWATLPLKKYVDFSGRAPRAEYWWFYLLILVAFLLIFIVTSAFGSPVDPTSAMPIPGSLLLIGGLFVLAIFLPSLAVQVRRLHDQGKSGWWILLNLVPYIGGLVILVFMVLPGTTGANQYGEDPYGRA